MDGRSPRRQVDAGRALGDASLRKHGLCMRTGEPRDTRRRTHTYLRPGVGRVGSLRPPSRGAPWEMESTRAQLGRFASPELVGTPNRSRNMERVSRRSALRYAEGRSLHIKRQQKPEYSVSPSTHDYNSQRCCCVLKTQSRFAGTRGSRFECVEFPFGLLFPLSRARGGGALL